MQIKVVLGDNLFINVDARKAFPCNKHWGQTHRVGTKAFEACREFIVAAIVNALPRSKDLNDPSIRDLPGEIKGDVIAAITKIHDNLARMAKQAYPEDAIRAGLNARKAMYMYELLEKYNCLDMESFKKVRKGLERGGATFGSGIPMGDRKFLVPSAYIIVFPPGFKW